MIAARPTMGCRGMFSVPRDDFGTPSREILLREGVHALKGKEKRRARLTLVRGSAWRPRQAPGQGDPPTPPPIWHPAPRHRDLAGRCRTMARPEPPPPTPRLAHP